MKNRDQEITKLKSQIKRLKRLNVYFAIFALAILVIQLYNMLA